MRESDITQPLLDKCKQIAEHWRMEIYHGCWAGWNSDDGLDLVATKLGVALLNKTKKLSWFPIPSVSDCESRLEEAGLMFKSERQFPSMKHEVYLEWIPTWNSPQLSTNRFVGSTLHLALLSALLKVLKND